MPNRGGRRPVRAEQQRERLLGDGSRLMLLRDRQHRRTPGPTDLPLRRRDHVADHIVGGEPRSDISRMS